MMDTQAEPIQTPWEFSPDINDPQIQGMRLESTFLWAATTTGQVHWRSSQSAVQDKASGVVDGILPRGVSVDMYQPRLHCFAPLETNFFGTLKFTVCPKKLHTTKPLLLLEFKFKQPITVRDLYGLMHRNKLQFYRFHTLGSGCLHWQLNLLGLMESQGWLKEGSYAEAWEAAKQVAGRLNSDRQMPWPPRKGTFYPDPGMSTLINMKQKAQ